VRQVDGGRADESGTLFSGVRVLDLAGPIGAYCSKLLADLGADVVKVEPPSGDSMRRTPPVTDAAGSLVFASYHANKRGITLDVGRPGALPVFDALGPTCDVVLLSPSARRPVAGFDRDALALSWATPDTIVASITPFGLTGPWRDMRMTSFLSYAICGQMHFAGMSDGPPLAAPGQMAWDEAGIHGALGISAAMVARDRVGGQLLDLAVHEVEAAKDFLLERFSVERPGGWGRMVGVGIPPTGVWQCADGPLAVAAHQRHHWQAFLAMLDQPEDLQDPAFADPVFRREIFDALDALISPLMAERSRLDLFDRGQRAGLPCAPDNTPGEFVRDVQPRARDTFVSANVDPHPHPGPGPSVRIPWRWAHSSAPLLSLRRGAPALGEHNEDIYVDELGFSRDDLDGWKACGLV
jgi:crotonobetainyl-CoA:carnitine CoA-transferase CaiB-like acyl-CoA transferase